MKTSFISLLIGCFSTVVYGQKQFSSKPEALEFIKNAFAVNFVKTYVDHTGMEKLSIFSYDYEISDKYLLIIHKTKGLKYGLDFTLLPFDKIELIRSDNDNSRPNFKTVSSLIITSHCRCFKFTENSKKFSGEDVFDELRSSVYFPFNVNDEKFLVESLQNAFHVLSGK